MKRYTLTIEVEGEMEQVARLRTLLPEFLTGNGVRTVTGTRTVETWMVAETEALAGNERLDWGPAIASEKNPWNGRR